MIRTRAGRGRPRLFLCLFLALLAGCGDVGQGPPPGSATDVTHFFTNPVIPGFAPDPSIVRVGGDFYLVNSSFEYFPGIPVYHSADLVNWRLIGHALHRPEQAELFAVASSGGIHAATIRHHQGVFYVITTNVTREGPVNFILTATDPRGPWSDAFVLEGAPGIDPSLFFDEDGRVWYTGNRQPPDPEFPGQSEIWLQELDLKAMRLTGPRHYLWRGCCGGTWAEGPHIYKRDGYYYLLISEGGTAYEHAMAVAIAKNITGPYQNNPRNPVLTHRHLSYRHPITDIGHGDLVELADGRWYAVVLGRRRIDGLDPLGRETFLVPVVWETEPYPWKKERFSFPVFAPRTGRVEAYLPTPLGGPQKGREGFVEEFDRPELSLQWNFRRPPRRTFHELGPSPGALRLRLQPGALREGGQYSFIGVRQRDFQFSAEARMRFSPAADNEEAGLMLVQNDKSAFLMTLSRAEGGGRVRLDQLLYGERRPVSEKEAKGEFLHLKITGDRLRYDFAFSADGENWSFLGRGVDASDLAPAVLEGFNYTGVYIGLYASSNGAPTSNYADFLWFAYHPIGDD